MARVLFLLPALDFDPSEAAVSWQVLVNAGHVVRFATPDGRPAVADDMMLTGRGLALWVQIPLLRNLPLLGLLMRANRNARLAYARMIVDPNYVAPQRWDAIDPMAFDRCCCLAVIVHVACAITLKAMYCNGSSPIFSMKRSLWRQSVTACSWRRVVSR